MPTRTRTHRGIEYQVSEAHPAADLFPWMTEDALQALANDIAVHGQQYYIERLFDGRVLDGRNRELACRIAGREPVYADLDYTDEQACAHVFTRNLHRRDLSPSQRAMIAAELSNMAQGQRTDITFGTNAEGSEKVSQADAAEQLDVSVRYVVAAARVKDEAPELVPLVKSGDLTVSTAARVAELPPEVRQEVATAEDPKAKASEVLAATKDEDEAGGEEEYRPEWQGKPLDPNRTYPKKAPEGFTPGNKVDPDHPHAEILKALTALKKAVNKSIRSGEEASAFLKHNLSEFTKLVKFRQVLHTSGKVENGVVTKPDAEFVGLALLRSVVRKSTKKMTPAQLRKLITDNAGASEAALIQEDGE